MAEIQESSGKGDGGKVRSKKSGGKPDMTPMVDLGFLLITFFMFTTTFSKPNVLPLTMPLKEEEPDKKPPEIKESNTITIIMGKDDRVFWYQAAAAKVTEADLHETDYSAAGIRSHIVDKKNRALDQKVFTVIIKPTDDANFKNTVDILDEMEITGNKQYAIVDIMDSEKEAYEAKIKIPKKVE